MFERFREALVSSGKPFVTLTGSYENRFEQAKKALDELLTDDRFLLDRFPKNVRWIRR
jgi:nicotinamide riboside kinase